MILLKGAEVSSKIKTEVLAAVSAMEGHVPTAAIVRVGERPDDVSYEKNAMKKIAAFGMEARSYVFPEDISQQGLKRNSGRSIRIPKSTESFCSGRCPPRSPDGFRSG